MGILSLLDHCKCGVDLAVTEVHRQLQNALCDHLHALLTHLEALDHGVVLLVNRNLHRNKRGLLYAPCGLQLELGGGQDLEGRHEEALLSRGVSVHPAHPLKPQAMRQLANVTLLTR